MTLTLFDLDGVLARGDTVAALVARRLLGRPLRLLVCLPALLRVAAAAAGAGRLPAANRRLVATALAGMSDAGYTRLAERTAARLAARPRFVVAEAVAFARERAAAGRLIVVTGSERRLARAFLDGIGLGEAELIASELRFGGGRGGRVRFAAHTVGEAKVTALRERGVETGTALFATDSRSDLPLAERVAEVVLVNPSARAERAYRERVPGVRVARW